MEKAFHIGVLFDEAATRHGAVSVTLDQPLQLAPQEGTTHTFASLAGHVARMSGRLRAAGVGAGDHVALYKTDNFDIVLLACAIARIGAVPTLLSATLDPRTVAVLLARLGQPWLLTDQTKLDTTGLGSAVALPPTRGVLLSAGEETPGTVALSRHADAPVPLPVRHPADSPAFITHTSGTTDVPKLVVQQHRALWYRFFPQQLASWPIRGRETFGLCMSFVHARFYSAIGIALWYGNPLVVAVDASPEVIGPLFSRTRPGYVETQPNTFVDWEELARVPDGPLANVRWYFATFDAMHPRTIRTLLGASRRRSPRFIQVYGQSETGPVTSRWYSRRGDGGGGDRSVGWPLPGFARMRAVDDEGRPLARGGIGHLEVSHHGLALTYLGQEQRFAEQVSPDGWWRMGDQGFVDRFGRVHLLDRTVDQIDAVGSNLHVEDELMSRLPELREVVVITGPDGTAVPVVATRGEVALDLGRWQRATTDLGALDPPVQIRFDDLPRTATWKIRRPELARKLAQLRQD